MKIKALSRSGEESTRSNSGDLKKISRNLDPAHKPLERAREYARAVVGAKISKMFSKPFVAALEGHVDGISCSAASRGHLLPFVTGGMDGEVRLWDLATQKTVWNCKTAHTGWVRGICVSNTGTSFFSCGDDKTVKQWNLGVNNFGGRDEEKKKRRSTKKAAAKKDGKKTTEGGAKKKQRRRGDGDDGDDDDDDDSDEESESESESEEEEEEEEDSKPSSRVPGYGNNTNLAPTPKPSNSWLFPRTFKSIDHHWRESQFATASDGSVEVWSYARSNPVQSFSLWGDDSVNVVRYNPAERSLLASCSSDRGVGIFDIRAATGLRKVVLTMRSNCLEWNPMEPMNFTVGNEDHNCYSFDMRKLDQPTCIHKGHVGAVLSLGWSSTGREFVTGSYDRTVRIFGYRDGTSRDCYHTKRMQRVFAVNYTSDAKFVVSGSDDTNLRIWKARADEKLGQTLVREEKAMQYRNTLVKRFQHMPEVRKIVKSHRLPGFIKKQGQVKQVQKESAAKKQDNRVKHSKKGAVNYEPERSKVVVQQDE